LQDAFNRYKIELFNLEEELLTRLGKKETRRNIVDCSCNYR